MRGLIIIGLLLISTSVCSQSKLYLRHFVKENMVQLRLFPIDVETFSNGIDNGYIISRTNEKGEELKEFKIAPLKDRIEELLTSDDSITSGMADYVKGFFLSGNPDSETKSFSFGMLLIGSSYYRQVAEICGLYFEDSSADGSKYIYRVSIPKTSVVSTPAEVNSKKLSKNHDFTELIGSSRLDLKEVYLAWEAKELNDWYGGYYIYKSEDKENFHKLNKVPLFHFSSQYEEDKTVIDFVDTAVVEGKTYYYKVVPINHYSDVGIESNLIEVYIQKRLTGLCKIDDVISKKYERKIIGHYEGSEEEEVKEFILLRSDKIDSAYTILSTQSAKEDKFEFLYTADLLSGDRHYFKVAALSVDSDTVFSYPKYYFTLDQEPPGIPTDFEGVIDSAGIARFSWKAPVDKDIRGYRIYRANELKEEFVEVTRSLSTNEFYSDTLLLNNLTPEIYYKIRCIDLNYNNSGYSEPILLLKPDTIAPVPSLIKSFKVEEKGIQLSWNNSASEDVDVQYLIRYLGLFADTVLVFMDEYDAFMDTTCQLGRAYQYRLLTEDKSHNQAYSDPLKVVFELGYRKAPENFEGNVNREEKKIQLEWQFISDPIYAIQVYRAKNDGRFKLYRTIRENISEFEDDNLSINNEYHYKIKVVYKSGISSKMTDEISIIY
jgi:uncharacterized protein